MGPELVQRSGVGLEVRSWSRGQELVQGSVQRSGVGLEVRSWSGGQELVRRSGVDMVL